MVVVGVIESTPVSEWRRQVGQHFKKQRNAKESKISSRCRMVDSSSTSSSPSSSSSSSQRIQNRRRRRRSSSGGGAIPPKKLIKKEEEKEEEEGNKSRYTEANSVLSFLLHRLFLFPLTHSLTHSLRVLSLSLYFSFNSTPSSLSFLLLLFSLPLAGCRVSLSSCHTGPPTLTHGGRERERNSTPTCCQRSSML